MDQGEDENSAGPGRGAAAGEDENECSAGVAELSRALFGGNRVGRISSASVERQVAVDLLGSTAQPACNAPVSIGTKVRASSAERVRRHRARKKIGAQLEELTFVRRDWALFLDPYRLPQKAGCRSDQMRALALKELVDNGLDHAANVTLDQIDNDTWSVADDGPGMDRGRIATLFAVDRPLTSTKLLRRPTRGAVGNGLRVGDRRCHGVWWITARREPGAAVRDQGAHRRRQDRGGGDRM
jgi:Histidine kinase-, DNA gyrase B-, and HSP90-like ATPase